MMLLSAALVILSGLRAIFHWHDDWIRFTEACAQLVTARDLHRFQVGRYGSAARDQILIQEVHDIEHAETQGWLSMRRSITNEPSNITSDAGPGRPTSSGALHS